MKYKVNNLVGFKSKSVNTGKVIEYDKESKMYSVRGLFEGEDRINQHFEGLQQSTV